MGSLVELILALVLEALKAYNAGGLTKEKRDAAVAAAAAALHQVGPPS